VTEYAPPATTGRCFSGKYPLRSLPLLPVYFDQMCSGRMKNCSRFASTGATGRLYVTTTVSSSVALKFLTPSSDDASSAVGPLAYLSTVLPVHATSSAVSGLPSDHLPPGCRWNVHTRPFAECSHFSA